MRTGGRRVRAATGVLVTGALLMAGVAASAEPPLAAAGSTAVTRRGPAPFGSCPARDVRMVATVANPVVARGVPVRVTVTVRNAGQVPCAYHATPGRRRTQTIGPCGVLPLAVDLPSGHEIWPGGAVYGCPLLVGATLRPQGTLVVTGEWAQQQAPGSGLPAVLPVGRSVLVVAGRIRLRIAVR